MTSWHPTSKMFLIGTEVHACVQEGFASFWGDPGCLPLSDTQWIGAMQIQSTPNLVTQFPGISTLQPTTIAPPTATT